MQKNCCQSAKILPECINLPVVQYRRSLDKDNPADSPLWLLSMIVCY